MEVKALRVYKLNIIAISLVVVILTKVAVSAFFNGSVMFSVLIPTILVNLGILFFLYDILIKDRYYKYRNFMLFKPSVLSSVTAAHCIYSLVIAI